MNENYPSQYPIKLMIPFIVIILLAIIVAGVLLLSNSSSGADTKITSVDINKNLPNFTVTVHLKNVGDKGDTISVKAYLLVLVLRIGLGILKISRQNNRLYRFRRYWNSNI